MFSIRNLLITSALAMSVGCQFKEPNRSAALNDSPLIVDGAMKARDWEPTKAVYPNSSVPANTDRFILQASDNTVEDWGWASEPGLFVANSFFWPVTYIESPPGKWVEHPAEPTRATSNAFPKEQVIPPYGLKH